MTVAMFAASLSLWTAIPLAWIYIASQISDTQFPSAGPYAVAFVGTVVSILAVGWLLKHLDELYIRLTGTNTLNPIRPVWLRSMRDSHAHVRSTTVMEAVVLGSVLLAVLVFGIWFLFFAGSPLPTQ